MSTFWSRPSAAEPLTRIAHPLHTVAFLLIQGALVARSLVHANELHAAGSSPISIYLRTIITEWLMLAFVLGGVWLAKAPLTTVIGQHWRSARDVVRDVGIGIVFIILQQIVLSLLMGHAHSAQSERAIQFLLPNGRREMLLWLALSITAGICEEAIFRGYLQRQFSAFAKNIPVGILLSAALFGAAHGYQGLRQAIVIGVDGALLGGLAYWCRSVRPGMIGHTFKDALAPLLMARH
jgi:membrane protease YdiL (CAAX protease family)